MGWGRQAMVALVAVGFAGCGGSSAVTQSAVEHLVAHDSRLSPQGLPEYKAKLLNKARCRPAQMRADGSRSWSCDLVIGGAGKHNFLVLFGALNQHYDITVKHDGHWSARRRAGGQIVQGCCL